MKKLTLIKTLILMGLGTLVLGLIPGLPNQCYAQAPVISKRNTTWIALGGQWRRGLSVVINGESSITVVGVGTDDTRWTIESHDSGKTWGNSIGHKGALLSAPACDSGRCFWVSTGGFLWSQVGDGEFVGGISGMKATADPSVVDNYVFAHGANDDALWFARTNAGKLSGDWISMGGALKGGPSCFKDDPIPLSVYKNATTFTCYVVGADDAVWVEHTEVEYLKGTSSIITGYHYVWTKVGGQAIGGVNAFHSNYKFSSIPLPGNSSITTSTSSLNLAVRGTDSTLWLGHWVAKPAPETDSEWQWKNYLGKISSVPACANIVGTARNYCFAILPDGQLGMLDLTGAL